MSRALHAKAATWVVTILAVPGVALAFHWLARSDAARKVPPPACVTNEETSLGERLDVATIAEGEAEQSEALRLVPEALAIADTVDDPDPSVARVSAEELRAFLTARTWETDALGKEGCLEFVRRWTGSDPEGAAAWANGLPSGLFRRAACAQVAITWANLDSSAALNWSGDLPDVSERQTAVLAAAYEACRVDPMQAITAVCAMPAGSERDEFLAHAAGQWGTFDPGAAAQWAAQVPEPTLRERLLGVIAVSSAERAPVEGATLAATALSPGPEQVRVAIAVAQRWAQISPAEAAAWTAQFADPHARMDAQRALSILTTQPAL